MMTETPERIYTNKSGTAIITPPAIPLYETDIEWVPAAKLADALALPEVRALVEAAIFDAQLRAFEQRRLDTPDEIKAAANARIAAAQKGRK